MNIVGEIKKVGANLVTNGSFKVWQRGGSVVLSYGETKKTGADRFSARSWGAGAFTVSNSVVDGDDAYKVLVDASLGGLIGGSYVGPLMYAFEGQELYGKNGKKIKIKIKIKTNFDGVLSLSLKNSASDRSYLTELSVRANVIEEKELKIVLESDTTLNNDSLKGVMLVIGGIAKGSYESAVKDEWVAGTYYSVSGATNWGVVIGNSIEVIDIAVGSDDITDFIKKTYSEELLLCQRYYNVIGKEAHGTWKSGSTVGLGWSYPVEMRAAPTIALATTTPVIGRLDNPDDTGVGSTILTSKSGVKGGSAFIDGMSSGAGNGNGANSETDVLFTASAEL